MTGSCELGENCRSLYCCILRSPSFTQSKRIALLGNMPGVMMFIDTQLETLDCSMNASMQIDVAIDKLYYNVVSYVFLGKTRATRLRSLYSKLYKNSNVDFRFRDGRNS